ncbi:hypothetical protein [Nonomuraea candida]|uniref:hypothetical protein n=1 Tax=Nonomuraea candida TaxID=359159 RepID=UPI0012F76A38|nr:hypothetical protein [Nonomuraea candida]
MRPARTLGGTGVFASREKTWSSTLLGSSQRFGAPVRPSESAAKAVRWCVYQ